MRWACRPGQCLVHIPLVPNASGLHTDTKVQCKNQSFAVIHTFDAKRIHGMSMYECGLVQVEVWHVGQSDEILSRFWHGT